MKQSKKGKLLSFLLCFAMVLGMFPLTSAFAAGSGSGTSSGDPRVVSSFADFKAAMEESSIQYVKLTGGEKEDLPDNTKLEAAITVAGTKYLTVEGNKTFASNGGYGYDCLLSVMETANLYVSGTGTLQFSPKLSGGSNAVIRQDGGNVSVTGSVTLKSRSVNYATYGYAINHHYGWLDIAGGNLIGSLGREGSNAAVSVKCGDSSNVTISGGKFEVELFNGAAQKQPGLSIYDNYSTKGVELSGGTYTNGIETESASTTYNDYLAEGCTAEEDENGTVTISGSSTTPDPITELSATVTKPVAGVTAPKNIPATVPTDANYTAKLVFWIDGSSGEAVYKFEAGHSYYARVSFTAKTGYTIDGSPNCTINGKPAHASATRCFDSETYTLEAASEPTPINSVSATVITPKAGKTPNMTASVPSGAHYTAEVNCWYDIENSRDMTSSDTFAGGKTYRVEILFRANEGYTFVDATTAMINTLNGKLSGIGGGGDYTAIYFTADLTASGTSGADTLSFTKQPVGGSLKANQNLTYSFTVDKDATYVTLQKKNAEGEFKDWEGLSDAKANTSASYTIGGKAAGTTETYRIHLSYNGEWYNSDEFTLEWKADEPEPTKYSISVSASPTEGGTVTGDGTYDENDSVTVKATANAGYHFVKWTEDGTQVSTDAAYTFTATGNRVLVAVFEPVTPPPAIEHSITVVSGKATIAGGVEINKTAQGTEVTLTADPASPGEEFDKWEVVSGNVNLKDANTATTTFTMPNEDVSVKATYKASGGETPPPAPVTATVTFKVEHGTWSDKTTAPIEVSVELTDGKGTLEATKVPAGMIADAGYEGGAWNKTPDTTAGAVTGNVTYTYTFSEKSGGGDTPQPTHDTATVTFNVKNGTWADGTTAPKTVEVVLKDGKGTLKTTDVPTGMKADKDYANGAWVTKPNTNPDGITKDMTYTYTFTKLDHIPKTGDESHVALWSLLSVVSLGMAAALLYLNRKRKGSTR